MKNILTFLFAVILNSTFLILHSFATSYTWTGTTSTAWATTTNWTPSGTPGSGDNVTIVSASNLPALSGNVTVTNFTMTSGTLSLGGYTLTATGTVACNGGTINSGTLNATGSSSTFAGTTFGAAVTVNSGTVVLNGSVFNSTSSFTKTGSSNDFGSGNNEFNDVATFVNSGSGYFVLGTTNPDEFNDEAHFSSSGNYLAVAYGSTGNVFAGDVYLASTSGTGGVLMNYNGTATYSGDIYVEGSTGNCNFGNGTGSCTLASGKTIKEGAGGLTAGELKLKSFTKYGTTPINLDFGTGGSSLNISTGCTINGTITYSGGVFFLAGATFNHDVSFTMNYAYDTYCTGGNTFNGSTTFTNTTAQQLYLGSTNGDDFNGNVTFVQSSTGRIYPGYNGTTTYAGNITANGANNCEYGNGAGLSRNVLDGSTVQYVGGTAPEHRFLKLKINKGGGYVDLESPVGILDSLVLTDGIVKTNTTDYLMVRNNAKAIGASDSSHVEGVVVKGGDDAFTYPVGRNGHYRQITMSAPANTSDVFYAEYFEKNSNDTYSHSSKDAGLAEMSRNEYWNMVRYVGSSTVNVTLSWDTLTTSCSFASAANLKVASWDGSTWKDKGNGGTTGNLQNGTVITSSASSTYGAYTLGTSATFECYDDISLPPLDKLLNFAMLAGDDVTIDADAIDIHGKGGAYDDITGIITASNGTFDNNSGDVPDALVELEDMIDNLSWTHGLGLSLAYSRTIEPGIYRITGNTDFASRLTLLGDEYSVYVFIISGDLNINSHAETDIGNVLPENIYWIVSGDIVIEDSITVYGLFAASQTITTEIDNGGKTSLWALEDVIISGEEDAVSLNSFYSASEMGGLQGGDYAAEIGDCEWVTTGGSSNPDGGEQGLSGFFSPSIAGLQDICTDGAGNSFMGFTCNGQECNLYDISNNIPVNNPEPNAVLIMYNDDGTINWWKTNEADNGTSTCRTITYQEIDDDKYIYMAGEFYNNLDFGTGTYSSSDGQIYIAVFDADDGTLVNFIQDGGSHNINPPDIDIRDIDADKNGDIYITGAIGSGYVLQNSIYSGSLYVAKYNFSFPHNNWVGFADESKFEVTSGLVYTESSDPEVPGKVHVAGTFYSYLHPSVNYLDMKYYEPSGVLGTTFNGYGVIEGEGHDCMFILDLNSDNGEVYAPTCTTYTSDQGSYYFVDIAGHEDNDAGYVLYQSKADNSADVMTSLHGPYGISLEANIQARGIGVNVNATSYSNPDIYITGRYTGNQTYAGSTITSANNSYDIFVVKLDNLNLNNPFIKSYGGNNADKGVRITADDCHIYSTGTYTGLSTFRDDEINSYWGSQDVYALRTLNEKRVNIEVTGTTPICGNSVELDAGEGYDSYLWSPGGETTQTIDVSVPGIYIVEVSSECCNNISAEIEIEAEENCCYIEYETDTYAPISDGETYDPDGSGNASLAYGNLAVTGYTITGTTFVINGTFTITDDLTLDGCTVYLTTDAEIILVSPATLTLTNGSHLLACNDMWERIYVPEGTTIEVNTGSIIEDAKTAIDVETGEYIIDGSYLNKNYVHMKIRNLEETPWPDLGEITNSYFTCQDAWDDTDHTVLLPPHGGERTHIGIDVGVRLDFDAGVLTDGNHFDNADYGILADIRSYITITDNEFTNLDYGIHSSGDFNVSITENEFATINYCGILLWNEVSTTGEKMIIDGNTITDDDTHGQYFVGIYGYNNIGAKTEITNNDIDLGINSENTSYGILVWEISEHQPVNLKVTGNEVDGAYTGIGLKSVTGQVNLISNTGTAYVGDNTVTHTKTLDNPNAGILLQNCRAVLVVDNEVSNPVPEVNEVENGIRQEMGNTNFLFCNNTHDVGRGIYVTGDVRPYEALVMNMMDNNETGLFIKEGKIGQQGYLGNPWDNQWGTTGTWSSFNPNIMTSGSSADGSESKFVVRNAGSTYQPSYIEAEDGASLIPNPVTTNSTWQGDACPYFEPPQFMLSPEDRSVQLMKMIKDKNGLSADIDSAQNWNSRWGLYQYLPFDEDAVAENDSIQDFIDSCFVSNMGIIDRAMSYVNYYLTDPDGYIGVHPATDTDLDYLDSLDNMTAANASEQHLIDLLSIIFTNSTNSVWGIGETDVDDVRGIAELCPYSDGFGVYMARALMILVDTIPEQYMNECEGSASEKWDEDYSTPQAESIPAQSVFKIYPNPNSGNIMLEYSMDIRENGVLQVYDLTGNLIFTQVLVSEKDKTAVDLKGISSGIYIIRVEVAGINKLTERMVIMD